MFVDFNILNQLGSPSINSNVFANRPSAGQVGRLFVSTDTFEIYRDNGTTWDLIGGPGSSTVTGTGAATQIAYWTSSQAIGGSNNLWWDNTNGFLGVKTNTPTAGTEVVQTDGVGVYANFTTVAGSGAGTTALLAKNTTNSSGYAAVIEERTPNSSAGQYPVLIRHTLSSGTAAANMATGIHFGLPDNAGTERINQFSMDTVDAAAATYSSRYRFLLRSNGAAVTPFYITGTGLGVFTATPGAALDIHSTGVIAQLNSTGATNNGYLAFQRSGTGVWRMGDTYNGGNNYFELHNTVLTSNAIEVTAASNEALFVSAKTYTTGNAIGVAVRHNLTIPNGTNVGLAAIGGVNSNLNLILGGSTTIANTGRQGLEGSTTINFTGAGTLTMTQGTTLRALSALSTVYAFNGSAVGTITHLAGMRICFPDNPGSAVNITNNYGILINDQTTGTGTVTYTNRWGVYQEGASDTNYFAGTTLVGTTVNAGYKLDVSGSANATTLYENGVRVATANSVSGTTNYVPKFTSANVIGNSQIFDNGTNVGINTNSPNTKLQITSNSAAGTVAATASIVLSNRDTTNSTFLAGGIFADIYRDVANPAYGAGIWFERIPALGNASSDANIIFGSQLNPNSGLPTERMRINNGGSVGIGTNAPSALLHVYAGASSNSLPSNAQAIFEYNANGGIAISVPTGNAGGVYFPYSTNPYQSGIDRNGTDLRLRNGNDDKVIIKDNGNFLIGTTTDAGFKLDVNGTSIFRNKANVSISLSDYTFTAVNTNSGSYGLYIQAGGTNAALDIYNYNATTLLHTLSGTGNAQYAGSIRTGNPNTGTSGAWKLGSRVAATVVVNTTEYIEVDIGGTLYKLATVT